MSSQLSQLVRLPHAEGVLSFVGHADVSRIKKTGRSSRNTSGRFIEDDMKNHELARRIGTI